MQASAIQMSQLAAAGRRISFPAYSTGSIQRKTAVTSCYKKEAAETAAASKKTYYELLGVAYDSTSQQIKEAYRKLQKIHHPDIAGQKGHDRTLLLNEAYKVLMSQDSRNHYDVHIFQHRNGYGKDSSVHSLWNGPERPEALFVDMNHCVGCRECTHYAGKTFTMDETTGCARVKVQYGDELADIQVSVDSCPVNCILWVAAEELQVLEYMTQPQAKEGYGIFGQGWERPKNVFMAAEAFKKKMNHQKNGRTA